MKNPVSLQKKFGKISSVIHKLTKTGNIHHPGILLNATSQVPFTDYFGSTSAVESTQKNKNEGDKPTNSLRALLSGPHTARTTFTTILGDKKTPAVKLGPEVPHLEDFDILKVLYKSITFFYYSINKL